MNSNYLHKPKRRTAFSMTEMVVTLAITGAIMVGGAQLMTFTARHGREVENRRLATVEAGNVMEQAMTRPWDELCRRRSGARRPDPVRHVSPGATGQTPDGDRGRRSFRPMLAVSPSSSTGPSIRPNAARACDLVAWRYPLQETQP